MRQSKHNHVPENAFYEKMLWRQAMIVVTARQHIILAALSLLAVAVAACSPAPPLATPAADPRENAEVEFRVAHNVELRPGHAIEVTYGDGRQVRTLTPDDLTTIQKGHTIAGPFQTATNGDLEVTGVLVDRDGAELAKGTVELPLEPDRRYGVWVIIGSGDPTTGCMGCAGSLSFPIDPAAGYTPAVSLAIVWGTNSISNPVVY